MRPDDLLGAAMRWLGPGTPLHGSLRNSGWYVGADIPPKKLAGAREGFASLEPGVETPVLLYDGTVFGSAKRGLLLTNLALHWSITSAEDGFSEVRGRLPLGAIKQLAIAQTRILVNLDPIGTIVEPDRKEARALQAFFEEIQAADAGASAGDAPALSPMARRATAPLRPDVEEVFAAIRGLKALRDEGALSETEYAAKKAELLQRI